VLFAVEPQQVPVREEDAAHLMSREGAASILRA
jgi:hypothetical protein